MKRTPIHLSSQSLLDDEIQTAPTTLPTHWGQKYSSFVYCSSWIHSKVQWWPQITMAKLHDLHGIIQKKNCQNGWKSKQPKCLKANKENGCILEGNNIQSCTFFHYNVAHRQAWSVYLRSICQHAGAYVSDGHGWYYCSVGFSSASWYYMQIKRPKSSGR